MARKRGKRKSQRVSKRSEKRRLRKQKALAKIKGFENVGADNPFANTNIAQNASEDVVTRMQRRFNADAQRARTFERNYGINKGYDAVVSILGSTVFQMLKESTSFDSDQLIDLVKQFDQDVEPEVIEQAMLNYIHELTLPSYVEIENIQEAIDAGFTIEEAVEWAELNAIETESTRKTAYIDIHDLIDELLREMRVNGNL